MLTTLSNRAVCAIIFIAILTGCNVTTRPDGTTQQRIDPEGIFKTWDMAVDRSTALEIEYMSPATTPARKQAITAERQIETTMFKNAVEAALTLKPVIEVRIVIESQDAAPVAKALRTLVEDPHPHADGTVPPPASTRPDAR